MEQLVQTQPGQNGVRIGVDQSRRPVGGRGAPVGVQHPGQVGNQEIDQVHADPVEHNGSQNLVDIEQGLKQAGKQSPKGAAQSRRQDAHIPRLLQLNGAGEGQKRAHGILARGADVKQAHLIGKGHRQTHHNQGGGPVQDVAHIGKALTQQVPHARKGIAGVQKQQQEQAEKQTDANRGHRSHDAQQAGVVPQADGFLHAVCPSILLAPAIYRPSSCTSTVLGWNSPTISPSYMTRIRSDRFITSSSSRETNSTAAP